MNGILADLSQSFYKRVHCYGFRNVSVDRLCEIEDMVNYWLEDSGYNKRSLKDRYGCLLLKLLHTELPLKSDDERLAFLILASDPKLRLLTLYHEFCNLSNIKAAALKELYFYDSRLKDIEELYYKRFLNEIPLTIFEQEKKY